MAEERWLPVVGYEGLYEVSDAGRVRSVDRIGFRGKRLRGRILAFRMLPNGRPRVSLSRDGVAVDAYPYHLVLEAFAGPRPDGMECLHWDDDSMNNGLPNLRWGTRAENMRDMSRNGGGNAGLTHCPAGHQYTSENTYIYPGTRKHRGCRTCGRAHSARKRERARAKTSGGN